MRRLLSAVVIAGMSSSAACAEDVSALLLRQTQAFSDAGQRGDGAEMTKYLDTDVIFFNETGERATRADFAGATPPPAGTPVRAIATTDWNCKVYGDVAVTSFIDVVQPGKPDEVKFRSVETWRKDGAAWKMIGSETLTVLQDPPSVALDAQTLDQYAGTYEGARGLKFSFMRKGEALVASMNGGAETVQQAQARDIFYTPGHGNTPKVFQRDDRGHIVGFVYLLAGHSIQFKRTS